MNEEYQLLQSKIKGQNMQKQKYQLTNIYDKDNDNDNANDNVNVNDNDTDSDNDNRFIKHKCSNEYERAQALHII